MRNFECPEIETCFEDCRFCELNQDYEKIMDNYREMQLAEAYYDNFNKFNY